MTVFPVLLEQKRHILADYYLLIFLYSLIHCTATLPPFQGRFLGAPTKLPGHGSLPKPVAPGVAFRKTGTADICDLSHGSTLSCLESTASKKKNVSETSVFSTAILILQKKI